MISLEGRFPEKPEEFGDEMPRKSSGSVRKAWEKLSGARRHIRGMIDNGRTPKSEDFENLWGSYKPLFRDAQHGGKCAYCETRIAAGQSGDVEHFRPKAEVREPNEKSQKPGYWWLAYEWTNYLYACELCNRVHKKNRFPLKKVRDAMGPGAEKIEKPWLLNPFVEDPEPHFRFDECGGIGHTTETGRINIDVYGLDRDLLRIEREREAQAILELRSDYEDGSLGLEIFVDKMLRFCRPKERYAGMARSLLEQWLTQVGE